MEKLHPLKVLLQHQLATDASSVLHLPYVLSALTQEALLPSSHLPKWTARINSLLHSKDAGARWAGLCLAHKTSTLSRATMIECAHSWLGVALPLFSKNEPLPTLKSSVRLLRVIFSAGVGTPEYQRQVATPNIPKFTAAVIAIAEKIADQELRVLILETLTHLIPLYPTLYRASHTTLSTLSLRFLNGSAPNPTTDSLLKAASNLYVVLHFTGGKVGAANLWRKSMDDTLAFGWSAFLALRTTFANDGPDAPNCPSIDEALIGMPLNLDRLRCCTVILCDLMRSTTHRPIQLPLGPLIKFISALLSCTKDDKGKDNVDVATQSMEISLIPDFWKFGCELTTCLAQCARQHLTPNLTRLISYLTYHLEQKPTPSQRLFLLTTIHALLKNCHFLDSPLVPTRLAKAVLPSLTVVLGSPVEMQTPDDTATSSQTTKKGKKRARGYEGDEVFKLSREVICPGPDGGQVLFAALEVMRLVLRNPNLSLAMQSVSARVLLSMLLALPHMSPASLSSDLRLHADLLQLVQSITTELGSGTTSVMSKILGIVVRATVMEDGNEETLRHIEVLLHPRVPPLVRSMPHVESLSLFRAEESHEEEDVRKELGLHIQIHDESTESHDKDVIMKDTATSYSLPINHIQPARAEQPPPLTAPLVAPVTCQPVAAATPPQPSVIEQPEVKNSFVLKTVAPPPIVMPMQQEEGDDDDEMPVINMDSDSDEN